METTVKPLSAREMHKIVWVKVGVFSLFAIAFPLAMLRVSQMEKFHGFHVKSLTQEMKKPSGNLPSLGLVATGFSVVASSSTEKSVQTVPLSAGNQEDRGVNLVSQTAEITNLVELEALSQKLYEQLDRSWQTSPTFEQNLVYRVSAIADGAIADYEPLNQVAKDFITETPLPSLVSSKDSNAASSQTTAIGKFTVVFTPSGVLEVSR